jgi:hypothetical protein
MTTDLLLDWRKHRIGPSLPCRYCGGSAMCRDEGGRPCHKVCAEIVLATGANRSSREEGSA